MVSPLVDASKEWSPSFPRNALMNQTTVNNLPELVDSLNYAENKGEPGFVSAYSFPNGHSKGGNIPKVDTLFVDFDIEGKWYDGDRKGWRLDLSALLTRVRKFTKSLVEAGAHHHWRAALSGHKGIHLFLDFPPIDPNVGSFNQFKTGLNDYADAVTENLDEIAGGIDLNKWVDVVSADLGRLVRHPNTRHFGVKYTDEPRYCVPVSIKELTAVNVDRYEELTKEPRLVPEDCRRNPSEEAGSKVIQFIRRAGMGEGTSDSLSAPNSTHNRQRVEEYKKESNDDIEVEDLKLLTSDKPFVWEFRQREDAFQHGDESRTMELFIILDIINLHQAPIDVIVDFFRPIPGFDERYTRNTVEDLIARDYDLMRMETVRTKASEFYT